MKPTILYAGFGTALIGGLVMNKPILPIIFDHAVALTEEGWRRLTLRWGGFFFALAFLNEIVWRANRMIFGSPLSSPGFLFSFVSFQ